MLRSQTYIVLIINDTAATKFAPASMSYLPVNILYVSITLLDCVRPCRSEAETAPKDYEHGRFVGRCVWQAELTFIHLFRYPK